MDVQFMRFVELFGVAVTSTNLKLYTSLYDDFKVYPVQNLADDSFEKRYTLWRQGDHTAQYSINKILPHNDEHQMMPNHNHLPYKLQQIADVAATTVQASPFNNFTLKPPMPDVNQQPPAENIMSVNHRRPNLRMSYQVLRVFNGFYKQIYSQPKLF
jgi:hypothetical protein